MALMEKGRAEESRTKKSGAGKALAQVRPHSRRAKIAPKQISPEKISSVFAALGSESRLEVLRLLVRAGEDGLSVGEIQSALKMPASTLSHHLRALTATGLLSQVRQGREIRCIPDYALVRTLSNYLLAECCADEACWSETRQKHKKQ